MSDDTKPFDAPDQLPPMRQPKPGEQLFEFLVGHTRWLVELRDHGEYDLETRLENAPTRRLEPGEEDRLLAAATPIVGVKDGTDQHLRALIVAALSTGRVGELLSLTWGQIRHDEQGNARWIVLPANKTKQREPDDSRRTTSPGRTGDASAWTRRQGTA